MREVSRRATNLLTPLLLCTATLGCRDEHVSASLSKPGPSSEPNIVYSLAHIADQPTGSRVYLKNVSLIPILSTNSTGAISNFMVVDAEGQRVPSVVKAQEDSFLWRLIPSHGDRQYADFGAIVDRDENGAPVLSVFKLAF